MRTNSDRHYVSQAHLRAVGRRGRRPRQLLCETAELVVHFSDEGQGEMLPTTKSPEEGLPVATVEEK